MSMNFETAPEEVQKKILNEVSNQNFIEETADIDYQCYYEKSSIPEFWGRRLRLNEIKT